MGQEDDEYTRKARMELRKLEIQRAFERSRMAQIEESSNPNAKGQSELGGENSATGNSRGGSRRANFTTDSHGKVIGVFPITAKNVNQVLIDVVPDRFG